MTTFHKPLKQQKRSSPSKAFLYSPLTIQHDQKQLIISKLKQQIVLLKQNESEFNQLRENYKNLDYKYHCGLKEKESNDNKFAKYHETSLKEISQMKNYIDEMKMEYREKKIEMQDLKADQNTLKNQLDQKQIEIENLKNQLKSSLIDNEELNVQHSKLAEIHRAILKEREIKSENHQRLKIDVQSIKRKEQDLKNYHKNLKDQERVMKSEIVKFEEQNNKIDQDICQTCQDLAIINGNIDQASIDLQNLQRKIAQATSMSQKFKSQALLNKKSVQNQTMKNNDLVKDISNAQNLHSVRHNQVQQGNRELQVLTQENTSLEKINSQLQDDLEACKRHLENLASLNNNLIQNMKNISQEDEHVKIIIDRGARVQRAIKRVSDSKLLYKDQRLDITRDSSFYTNSYSTSRKRYF